MIVLDQRDRFDSAADRDLHSVVHDLLGCGCDGHETGRALTVDRHSGNRIRKPGPQHRLPCDVAAGRALLQRGAEDDVLDLAALEARALNCIPNGMCSKLLSLSVVERAAVRLTDRGSGRWKR